MCTQERGITVPPVVCLEEIMLEKVQLERRVKSGHRLKPEF